MGLFQCWWVVDGIFGVVVGNDGHFLVGGGGYILSGAGWWRVFSGILVVGDGTVYNSPSPKP